MKYFNWLIINGLFFDSLYLLYKFVIKIKFSEIPIYEEPDKYNEILKKQYYIKKGEISTCGDKISTQADETIIINKNIDTTNSKNFYTYVRPNSNTRVELIFGMSNFKLVNKYYSFMINENGNLTLNKYIDGKYENLISNQAKYIENYNKNNTYKMEVYFNSFNGSIVTHLDNNLIYSITDVDLKGNKVGFISYSKNTIITQIISEGQI